MEYVPYEFLDSVADLLSDDAAKVICNVSSATPHSSLWTVAVRDNYRNRQIFTICYGSTYHITSGDRSFTFEEFKRIDKRHVRVSSMKIGGHRNSSMFTSEEQQRLQEDIAAFTAQFVNMAVFDLHYSYGAGRTLFKIPSYYRDCNFSQIYLNNDAPTSLQDFLLAQLGSRLIQRLWLIDPGLRNPGILQSALEEYARDREPYFRWGMDYDKSRFVFFYYP